MSEIIIVGVGNPYRGDDGAGWAVIDGLKKRLNSNIELLKQKGDIAEIIDIFSTHPCVYLVDACSSQAVHSWQRIDVLVQPIQEKHSLTSTHGFSIAQAVSLAKNLGQLPNKLILYAINGDHYAMSDVLSPSVKQSIDHVINEILNEEDIRACTNTV